MPALSGHLKEREIFEPYSFPGAGSWPCDVSWLPVAPWPPIINAIIGRQPLSDTATATIRIGRTRLENTWSAMFHADEWQVEGTAHHVLLGDPEIVGHSEGSTIRFMTNSYWQRSHHNIAT